MAPFQACYINGGREDGAKREHKISNEAINVEALGIRNLFLNVQRANSKTKELKEGLRE
jgi:hypothetical protein